jgi:biopolymer transport protein ExbD
MPRRTIAQKNHAQIELFPFLSVLACTIGTLILLIIILTTQSLGQQEVEIVAKEDEKGVNAKKSPRYVECRSDGIILHPNEELIPMAQIQKSNSPLKKLIAEVKANRDREYLIVALRPNAIDVFNQVRTMVEQEEIDIGYEPIDATWTLKTKEQETKKQEVKETVNRDN